MMKQVVRLQQCNRRSGKESEGSTVGKKHDYENVKNDWHSELEKWGNQLSEYEGEKCGCSC